MLESERRQSRRAGIAYATIPAEQTRPGPPAAYAYVSGDGTIVIGGDGVAHARNVSDANISHPSTGVYCFTGLDFQPRAIVGTGTHETTLVSGQVVVCRSTGSSGVRTRGRSYSERVMDAASPSADAGRVPGGRSAAAPGPLRGTSHRIPR
jgi:hypothetical protein